MKIGESLNPYSGLSQLNQSLSKANEVSQQISTGNRLTKASVDPSALVISERMKAQITQLTKEAENISMEIMRDQTAEAAYAGITENLQRINELTVQAQNGTLTGEDRAIIEQEISQLTEGISDIAANTQFNATNVIPSGLVEQLGISNISIANPEQASEIISSAIEHVSSLRSEIGGKINANVARANVLEQTAVNTVEAKSRLADTDISAAVSELTDTLNSIKTAVFGVQAKNEIASATLGGIMGFDQYG